MVEYEKVWKDAIGWRFLTYGTMLIGGACGLAIGISDFSVKLFPALFVGFLLGPVIGLMVCLPPRGGNGGEFDTSFDVSASVVCAIVFVFSCFMPRSLASSLLLVLSLVGTFFYAAAVDKKVRKTAGADKAFNWPSDSFLSFVPVIGDLGWILAQLIRIIRKCS